MSILLNDKSSVLTTEEGVFITVVSTVVITITQVSREDADVGVITLD